MKHQENFPFIGIKLTRKERVQIIMSGVKSKGAFFSRKRLKLKKDLLNFHYEIIDYLMACKNFDSIKHLESQIHFWINMDEAAKQYVNPVRYKIGNGKEFNKALLKKYNELNEAFEVAT